MKKYAIALLILSTAAVVVAQQPQPAQGPPPGDTLAQAGPPPAQGPRPGTLPPPPANRPPLNEAERALLGRAFHSGPPGRWWNNPEMAQKLNLTSDQQKKMDDIFQQNRLRLVDLNARLQIDELILEPLLGEDQPDEPKILAQIDRVAQDRAELEKANARMLLGIRRVLNQDQWKKLQAEGDLHPTPRPGGPPPHRD